MVRSIVVTETESELVVVLVVECVRSQYLICPNWEVSI